MLFYFVCLPTCLVVKVNTLQVSKFIMCRVIIDPMPLSLPCHAEDRNQRSIFLNRINRGERFHCHLLITPLRSLTQSSTWPIAHRVNQSVNHWTRVCAQWSDAGFK